MDYLVVYDIKNHKVRNKVSRILQKFGYRILYSAFFLKDLSREKLNFLYEEISKLVDHKTDRVFFYPVDEPEIFKGYPLEPWKIFVI